MTCHQLGGAIVCGPPRGVYHRLENHCPECDATHGFVETWDGAWYGTTLYGSCGDRWQEGWRAPRPFARYWRRDAQARFQRMWDHAAPDDLYSAYIRADIEMATTDLDDESVLAGAIARRRAAHDAILAHQAEVAS